MRWFFRLFDRLTGGCRPKYSGSLVDGANSDKIDQLVDWFIQSAQSIAFHNVEISTSGSKACICFDDGRYLYVWRGHEIVTGSRLYCFDFSYIGPEIRIDMLNVTQWCYPDDRPEWVKAIDGIFARYSDKYSISTQSANASTRRQ